jgi:hypothetical protein
MNMKITVLKLEIMIQIKNTIEIITIIIIIANTTIKIELKITTIVIKKEDRILI